MFELIRIPVLSLVAGIVLAVLEYFITFISYRTGLTFILDNYNLMNTCLAFVFFVAIGKLFLKDLTRKDIFMSATFFSLYYVVILLLQIFLIRSGSYSISFQVLFVPTKIYSVLSYWLLEISTGFGYWAFVPSIVMPYLYLVFPRQGVRT